MDELYEAAEAVRPDFKALLLQLAEDAPGVDASVPGLKGETRAKEKIDDDYGGDASLLCDVVRGSFLCQPEANIAQLVGRLRGHPSVLGLRKFKNRFGAPTVSS